jgi:hypothetical protein
MVGVHAKVVQGIRSVEVRPPVAVVLDHPKTAVASQFSISRGSQSPRSKINTRLPDEARRCVSVPPPAPDPTIITSYSSAMVPPQGVAGMMPPGPVLSSEMWGTSCSSSLQAMRCGAEEASTVAAWSRSK